MSNQWMLRELVKLVWTSTTSKVATVVAGIVVFSATTAVITHWATNSRHEQSSRLKLPSGPTYSVVFPYWPPKTADEEFICEHNDVVTYMNWVRGKQAVRESLDMADLLSSALAGDVTVVKHLIDLKDKFPDSLLPYVPRTDIATYQMSQRNYQGTRVPASPVCYQEDGAGRLILIERAGLEGIVLRKAGLASSLLADPARYEKYCHLLAQEVARFVRSRKERRGTLAATWMATMEDLEGIEATITRIAPNLERVSGSAELFYGAFYSAGWLVRDGRAKRETSLRTPEDAARTFIYALYSSDESLLRAALGRGDEEEGSGEELRSRHWPWQGKTPRELILEGVDRIEDGEASVRYFGMLPPLGKGVPRSGYDIGYGGSVPLYRDSRGNWRVGKTREMLAMAERARQAEATGLGRAARELLLAIYRDKSAARVSKLCTPQMAKMAPHLGELVLPPRSEGLVFYVATTSATEGYLLWDGGNSLLAFRKGEQGAWLIYGSGGGATDSYKENAEKISLDDVLSGR